MCAIYLYDAVYLYLLAVNQTLAEGYPDYRNGRLILNKAIGQRFAGRHSTVFDSCRPEDNSTQSCTTLDPTRGSGHIISYHIINIFVKRHRQRATEALRIGSENSDIQRQRVA